MSEQIVLREYQKTDHKALENVVREAWNYDRFCSPKTAAKMAKVYLSSCLTNQTFTRVAEINGEPVGIIMGKDIRNHKCPLSLRIKWIQSIVSLYISGEGRELQRGACLLRHKKEMPGTGIGKKAVSDGCRVYEIQRHHGILFVYRY